MASPLVPMPNISRLLPNQGGLSSVDAVDREVREPFAEPTKNEDSGSHMGSAVVRSVVPGTSSGMQMHAGPGAQNRGFQLAPSNLNLYG